MAQRRGRREDGDQPPDWKRFNAYLSPEQMTWLTQTRGRYIMESGRNLGATDLIRIAIGELQRRDWDQLKRLLDAYPGRGAR